ncbi:hypothetical protein LTR56_026715 [Elasticomyces elasticus]|nr:hypothetical protein LTR56_026715 [Elasticomyces elasticus]KAK3615567.1 hypothetical protein LTR22_027384 [Elasticomyces elasticus]KAK5716995.1 hypothetical protein LTS12_027742 [Elasticomyces elasticus]
MKNNFHQLHFGLLVGIGRGVPTRTDAGLIRLGHVVVSEPTGQHSGAVQYDHADGRRSPKISSRPTSGAYKAHRHHDPRATILRHPGVDSVDLYEPDYVHSDRDASCKECGCDLSRRVDRGAEGGDEEQDAQDVDECIVVHRGTITAGEKVMRNGVERDRLAQEYGALCFEMEAAGALNDFPCMVIRGISDYSNSHKNDK